jgi:hypothetical protein
MEPFIGFPKGFSNKCLISASCPVERTVDKRPPGRRSPLKNNLPYYQHVTNLTLTVAQAIHMAAVSNIPAIVCHEEKVKLKRRFGESAFPGTPVDRETGSQ